MKALLCIECNILTTPNDAFPGVWLTCDNCGEDRVLLVKVTPLHSLACRTHRNTIPTTDRCICGAGTLEEMHP